MASGPDGEAYVETAELDERIRETKFFRSLVENGSDAIVSIDEDSTIKYANRSVERVFGYAPEEMIGEKLTMIMPERFHDAHCGAVREYLATGERTMDWTGIELPAEHRDGHEVPLSITFEEHEFRGTRLFSGIMRDVSDRAAYERELERQNEQLERFASVVSHDLRDPLQTARATLAVAKAGDEDALAELEGTLDRMEELVEDVLALAKQGRSVGEAEPVALGEVAAAAWETAGRDAATLVAGELPTVRADPERLRTLLENLFRNAVEHGGEAVTVRVEPLADGFAVADDGPGFGEAAPDRLFEYGYTTSEDGTGFGLSIVRSIAEAHDWTVEAGTAASGGARLAFRGVETA